MDNHLIISNLTKQKTKQNNNHNKPTKLKQSNIMATTDYLKKKEPRVRIQSHYQNSTISSTVLVLIQEINNKGKIKW